MSRVFCIPKKVVTGQGALEVLGSGLESYGKKALLVTGKHAVKDGTAGRVEKLLEQQGIGLALYDGISGEPTDTMILEGLREYRAAGCDFLIGLGGGSPLDAMKAIGVLAVHPGKLSDYLGKEIAGPLPGMVAIPTTAGTGSEATQFTIITDTATQVKMLLKGAALLPDLAVVDPALSLSAPARVTASTGLDALTHSIEAYTSKKAQPLTDTLALSAVKRIFANLPTAYREGKNAEAREEMAMAALEAGMAFNNSSVTLVHGMSRPIGALFHVPHGLSNAMLLGVCLEYALPGTYERFAALGRAVGAAEVSLPDQAAAEAFLAAVRDLCETCQVPTLAEYGVDRAAFFAQIDKMAEDAMNSGSPANTRRVLNAGVLKELYRKLW